MERKVRETMIYSKENRDENVNGVDEDIQGE